MSARAGVIRLDDKGVPYLQIYVRKVLEPDSISMICYYDEELFADFNEGDVVIMSATAVRDGTRLGKNLIDTVIQQQQPLKEDVESKQKEDKK